MSARFERSGSEFQLRMSLVERTVLRSVPRILDRPEVEVARLDYTAHPDDPEADARYRDLVAGSLDELRRDDRASFDSVADGRAVTSEDVEAFMRVVGEARIVLAARLGIEEDGWEQDAAPDDPEVALLGWLGWLQESAIRALTD